MKNVLVIGSGGCGETTLGKNLSVTMGLPLIHLDSIYWRSVWKETPKEEWLSMIDRVVQAPEWIIDGNYGGTLDQRLDVCDTVILLDTSPWRCLWRAIKCRLRYAGQSSRELPPGCPERLDAKFLGWVLTYRIKRLLTILAKLKAVEHFGKLVIILRNSSEQQRLLSEASPSKRNPADRGLHPK